MCLQSHAHAVLIESQPQAGQALVGPPKDITLSFSEPIAPIVIKLFSGSGTDVDVSVNAENNTLKVSPKTGLVQDGYLLSYRILSLDGHPVGGTLAFSVGKGGAASPLVDTSQGAQPSITYARAIVRAVTWTCVLVLCGAALFMLLVHGAVLLSSSLVILVALLGLVSAALDLGLGGLELVGLGWAGLFNALSWQAVSKAPQALSAVAYALGLLISAGALVWSAQRAMLRNLVLGSGVLVGLGGFLLSGHIVTAPPRTLSTITLGLHILAAAYWGGALLPLYVAVKAQGSGAVQIVERFSKIALALVALLIASGVLIAWIQVQSWQTLVTTAYGQFLLVKLGLVGLLLGFAVYNKWRLTPALAKGQTSGLSRSVLWEMGVVAVVVVITSLLSTVPPPRAMPSMNAEAVAVRPQRLFLYDNGNRRWLTAEITPGWSGINEAALLIHDNRGQSFRARQVMLSVSAPELGFEEISRHAIQAADGRWMVSDVPFMRAGRWAVRIDAAVSDFDKAIFEGSVVIAEKGASSHSHH